MKFKRSTVYKNLIGLALLLGFASIGMSGKHAYPEFKDTISYETVEIMKKHGMPVLHDRDDQWFKISATPGNYKIWLHRADEIPRPVVLDIIKMCMDFYVQRGQKEQFKIVMYKESDEAWRKSLMFLGLGPARIKPFFELTIGEKQ